MLAQAPQFPALPTPKTVAVASAQAVSIGAVMLLCLFLLAGLIWVAVGGAVMRAGSAQAPAPRIRTSL
jgi:hypothetical protein